MANHNRRRGARRRALRALTVLALVLPTGCGVVRTARRTVGGIATVATLPVDVATLPLKLFDGSDENRKPGNADYSYTVRGRRYHVLSHADAHRYCDEGTASYYGTEAGSRTASGERMNPRALTAAHKTLPLNTRVRVTNLRNGKSVALRINDRGPFARGRIIDVSNAAASMLGFRDDGLAPVRIEAIPES